MTLDRLSAVVLPALKFFCLVHEGFKAGQCIGLLLAVIDHVEDWDIVTLLLIPLKQRADNRPGHAREGHDIDNPAGSSFGKIDRLPDR